MRLILNPTVSLFILVSFAALYRCSESEKDPIRITPDGIPLVTTATPESITATSAILKGSITNMGGDSIFVRGFDIQGENFDIIGENSVRIFGKSGADKFSIEKTGLWPGNRYCLRAYAKNNNGTGYGEYVRFSTPIPEVETDQVTMISQTAAKVSGSVNLIKYSDIGEKGFCYGTSPAPTTINGPRAVSTEYGTGTFTCNLLNLVPGTRYYVRAYVSGFWAWDLGYSEFWWEVLIPYYGNEKTFIAGESLSEPKLY